MLASTDWKNIIWPGSGDFMTHKRNIYLKKKSLAEARDLVIHRFGAFPDWPVETVSTPDAVGRVLAEPVFARLSAPGFHAAAMDGVAVRAAATFGASETSPKRLTVGVDAVAVNTGNVMPEGFDAVVMIEQVHQVDETTLQIEAPAFPWQYVRKMGEDIVATELLFPRHHRITPYCIGALLSGGIFEVPVRRRPRVAIVPTGSELVDWHGLDIATLQPGQVIESNAYVLEGLVRHCGGEPVRRTRVSDDPRQVEAALAEALAPEADCDIALTVGGSSAGSADYTKPAVEALGEVLVHGVTIMPGKPVLIGAAAGKPVIGIPGYPVSAIIAFEQFVQPVILAMLALPENPRPTLQVTPTRKIPSKLGVEEFVMVKLGQVFDRIVATALPRGAGAITSITEAHGIIRIPNNSEGIDADESVAAELLQPAEAVRNTIVVVGSHDNTLDILADQIRIDHGDVTVSSSHVGSIGGLMAVKRGVCHLAGTHLLDTETGGYNVSYIRRYLPGIPVRLVHLVMRDQGLIVPKGNPKKISGIEDLARGDVRFINRQGGSGTRILLDYRLNQLGIAPKSIRGYETEEFTHMAVAVAVLGATADVGLGIYAAARALDLDFIPVVTEQYDLLIPEVYFDTRPMRILRDTIVSEAFKRRVEALGGYSTRRTGEEIVLS
jgi:putative molybdopterin biosynthesis protein